MKALRDREQELQEILVRFFVGLEHEEKEIRVSTFFALSTLATLFRCLASAGSGASASYAGLLAKFLSTIATRKADFVGDRHFLRKLFGRMLSEDSTSASVNEKGILIFIYVFIIYYIIYLYMKFRYFYPPPIIGEKKDVHDALADKFTTGERAAFRTFVIGVVLNERTPKYLRLFLFHALRDVAAAQLVTATHDVVRQLLAELARGRGLSYFDANVLQVVLTSSLKPAAVASFNQREAGAGGRETKKELTEGDEAPGGLPGGPRVARVGVVQRQRPDRPARGVPGGLRVAASMHPQEPGGAERLPLHGRPVAGQQEGPLHALHRDPARVLLHPGLAGHSHRW